MCSYHEVRDTKSSGVWARLFARLTSLFYLKLWRSVSIQLATSARSAPNICGMRNHCGCGAEKEMQTDSTEHALQRQQVNVIVFFLWCCRVFEQCFLVLQL